MIYQKSASAFQSNKKLPLLIAAIAAFYLSGCVAAHGTRHDEEMVEIPNPALTMSPNAPETIWVPRKSVESGVPRAGELVKEGYQALKHSGPKGPAPAEPSPKAPEPPSAAPEPPRAPEPSAAAIVQVDGKQAVLIPQYGLVVAVDPTRVYFNMGQESGVKPGQRLTVYRGGTVVEGLGLAPGQKVATVEVMGFVGTKGGYGIVTQGGPVQKNDLIGVQ